MACVNRPAAGFCMWLNRPNMQKLVRSGNVEQVLRVLHEEPRMVMAASISNGYMLFHLAAEYGKVNVAQAVYDHMVTLQQQLRASPELCADSRSLSSLANSPLALVINAGNNSGQTPLHVACARGHSGMALWLLEHGANPWVRDRCGLRNCLHYAVLKGAPDAMDIVLSHPQASRRQGVVGANVSLRLADLSNSCGHSPLHYAMSVGNCDCVRVLLRHGAFVNARCWADGYDFVVAHPGSTPLHIAARKGSMVLVEMLLRHYWESGRDSGMTDPRVIMDYHGRRASALAAERQHTRLAKLLTLSTSLAEHFHDSSLTAPLYMVPKLKLIASTALQHALLSAIDVAHMQYMARKAEERLLSGAQAGLPACSTNRGLTGPTALAPGASSNLAMVNGEAATCSTTAMVQKPSFARVLSSRLNSLARKLKSPRALAGVAGSGEEASSSGHASTGGSPVTAQAVAARNAPVPMSRQGSAPAHMQYGSSGHETLAPGSRANAGVQPQLQSQGSGGCWPGAVGTVLEVRTMHTAIPQQGSTELFALGHPQHTTNQHVTAEAIPGTGKAAVAGNYQAVLGSDSPQRLPLPMAISPFALVANTYEGQLMPTSESSPPALGMPLGTPGAFLPAVDCVLGSAWPVPGALTHSQAPSHTSSQPPSQDGVRSAFHGVNTSPQLLLSGGAPLPATGGGRRGVSPPPPSLASSVRGGSPPPPMLRGGSPPPIRGSSPPPCNSASTITSRTSPLYPGLGMQGSGQGQWHMAQDQDRMQWAASGRMGHSMRGRSSHDSCLMGNSSASSSYSQLVLDQAPAVQASAQRVSGQAMAHSLHPSGTGLTSIPERREISHRALQGANAAGQAGTDVSGVHELTRHSTEQLPMGCTPFTASSACGPGLPALATMPAGPPVRRDTGAGMSAVAAAHTLAESPTLGSPTRGSLSGPMAGTSSLVISNSMVPLSDGGNDIVCGVCLERRVVLGIERCRHALCLECARAVCRMQQLQAPTCPFCRRIIYGFCPADDV